jgi:hypothetical protein
LNFAALQPDDGGASAGNALSLQANTDGAVNSLALAGSHLFIGGDFTSIADADSTSFSRENIAVVDVGSGKISGLSADTDGQVLALATDGQTVWVGGRFSKFDSAKRSRIAAIDANTGALTAFNPGAAGVNPSSLFSPHTPGGVNALALDGSTLYVGGDFTQIAGHDRSNIAALDAPSGHAKVYEPDANAPVDAVAVSSREVFAGGEFSSAQGLPRVGIAAIRADTGALTPFYADTDGPVYSFAFSPGKLWAGGDFSTVRGAKHANLVALRPSTGQPLRSGASPDGPVYAIATGSNALYLGGDFLKIGGRRRARLAEIGSNGALRRFRADTDSAVYALSHVGTTLYAGGTFSHLAGHSRSFLGAVRASDGKLLRFAPNPNGQIYTLLPAAGRLFVGGAFTQMGRTFRNGLAAVNPSSGSALSFNALLSGFHSPATLTTVLSLCQGPDGQVFAGGSFSGAGSKSRGSLAAFNPINGVLSTFDPGLDGSVYALNCTSRSVEIGGDFDTTATSPQQGIAIYKR